MLAGTPFHEPELQKRLSPPALVWPGCARLRTWGLDKVVRVPALLFTVDLLTEVLDIF
jgi:hypothetical protein